MCSSSATHGATFHLSSRARNRLAHALNGNSGSTGRVRWSDLADDEDDGNFELEALFGGWASASSTSSQSCGVSAVTTPDVASANGSACVAGQHSQIREASTDAWSRGGCGLTRNVAFRAGEDEVRGAQSGGADLPEQTQAVDSGVRTAEVLGAQVRSAGDLRCHPVSGSVRAAPLCSTETEVIAFVNLALEFLEQRGRCSACCMEGLCEACARAGRILAGWGKRVESLYPAIGGAFRRWFSWHAAAFATRTGLPAGVPGLSPTEIEAVSAVLVRVGAAINAAAGASTEDPAVASVAGAAVPPYGGSGVSRRLTVDGVGAVLAWFKTWGHAEVLQKFVWQRVVSGTITLAELNHYLLAVDVVSPRSMGGLQRVVRDAPLAVTPRTAEVCNDAWIWIESRRRAGFSQQYLDACAKRMHANVFVHCCTLADHLACVVDGPFWVTVGHRISRKPLSACVHGGACVPWEFEQRSYGVCGGGLGGI